MADGGYHDGNPLGEAQAERALRHAMKLECPMWKAEASVMRWQPGVHRGASSATAARLTTYCT